MHISFVYRVENMRFRRLILFVFTTYFFQISLQRLTIESLKSVPFDCERMISVD